jgi:hypothetical protein
MTVTRLIGYDAIAFAEEQHLKLRRFDRPMEIGAQTPDERSGA